MCMDPWAILMRHSAHDKADSAELNIGRPMPISAGNEVVIFSVISIRYQKVKHSLHNGGWQFYDKVTDCAHW